jgi:hypothetical protein
MKLVTYGDDPNQIKYLTSDYVNVGLGKKFVDLFSKFEALKEWLDTEDVDQDELIVFVDGYDVVQRRSDFETNFEKEFERFDADLVISGETFCWPNYYMKHLFAYAPTKYKYPNSGTFAGRAWAVRKMLEWGPYRINYDDQGYTQDFYLNSKSAGLRVVLDHHQDLFQTGTFIPFEELDRAHAFFVHFNGKSYMTTDGSDAMATYARGEKIGGLKKTPQVW